MKAAAIRRALARALTASVAASVILFPLATTATAATTLAGRSRAAAQIPDGASGHAVTSALSTAIPTVTADDTFQPTIQLTTDPWPTSQVKPMFDGIAGLGFSNPGVTVEVRAMSSIAFFVDEIWLVYPRVQYLFNSKDVLPYCGTDASTSLRSEHGRVFMPGRPDPATPLVGKLVKDGGTITVAQAVAAGVCAPLDPAAPAVRAGDPNYLRFSAPISLGSFSQGTELVFAIRNNAGIDNACRDRVKRYRWNGTGTAPTGVPNPWDASDLVNLEGRDYSNTDDVWKLATIAQLVATGDTRWTDVSAQGIVMDTDRCWSGTHRSATFAPIAPDPAVDCGSDLSCWSKAWPNFTPDGKSVFYTGPGARNVGVSFPQARLQYLSGFTTTAGLTGVFGFEDTGLCHPDGTGPAGCATEADYNDTGIVMTSLLAATCGPTATPNVIKIAGQPGYPSVELTVPVPSASSPTSLGFFAPGSVLTFTPALPGTTPTVTPAAGTSAGSPGTATAYTITAGDQVQATVIDPNAPSTVTLWDPATGQQIGTTANPDKTLPGGICWDPKWPPIRTIEATTTFACATGATAWDFTIDRALDPAAPPATTGVPLAGQAPPSITVTWSNGESATVPLSGFTPTDTSVTPNIGVAHYSTTLHTATSTGASDPYAPVSAAGASITGTWSGSFKLNGGPCGPQKTLTLATLPACDVAAAEWDFTVSGVTAALAPTAVSVTWRGGEVTTVSLSTLDTATGIAHYTTALHTGETYLPVTSVSATVAFLTLADADAFTGTLAAAGVPCPPAATPTPTPTPTATPTPAVTTACVPIYNPAGKHVPNAGDNPLSGENPDGFYKLVAVPGGSVRVHDTQSSYVTPAWPDGTTIKLTEANGRTPTYWIAPLAVDYEVRLKGDAEVWVYANAAGTGDPVSKRTCYVPDPPKGPTPSLSPSPSPAPSETPEPTPTPSPTDVVHVKTSTLADHECSSTQWQFVITSVSAANAPATIRVSWASGASATVTLDSLTGSTAHYRTTLGLTLAVVDATATISGTFGQFNLSDGPCLPARSPSPSPSPSSGDGDRRPARRGR